MRLIAKVAVLGVLAAGVAGCQDTNGAYDRYGYGPDHYRDRQDHDSRYDRGGYYGYDRDYDRDNRADRARDGARVYCRDENDRLYPCALR